MPAPTPLPRLRQPSLFAMAGPLWDRLGPEFFAALPCAPGVYFHYDGDGRLLYIGQSCNLRARISSYRSVRGGRGSHRLARLVSRIHRIDWCVCESAEAAQALEKSLLLEHRPPFNRAGVWIPSPWWVWFEADGDRLLAGICREPRAGAIGSLPASFRYTFASLLRAIFRWQWPETHWSQLPCGMASATVAQEMSLPVSGSAVACAEAARDFVTTGASSFLDQLAPGLAVGAPDSLATEFFAEDWEALVKFASVRQSAGCQPQPSPLSHS
jgi:hypothetical protein